MTRMTEGELVAAYDRRDWHALWEQGLTLVRPAIVVLNRQGAGFTYDPDTLQQAALFVGELVRRWRPLEGAFSTWIVQALGWRLRSWQRQQLRGQGLFTDPDDEAQPGHGSVERAVYEDAPAGYGDPMDEAIRLEERAAVMAALAALPPAERAAAQAIYGVDGLGGLTADEYALSAGVSRRAAFYTLDQARRRLALKLRAA